MHEYVQATILLDEAVTRFGTKPFDDTRGFHPLPPVRACAGPLYPTVGS
jgi:hypothetical protein